MDEVMQRATGVTDGPKLDQIAEAASVTTLPAQRPPIKQLDLSQQLNEMRRMQAPLFMPTGRDLRSQVKRLLNIPIRIFGRSQLRFNSRLLDTLSLLISEQRLRHPVEDSAPLAARTASADSRSPRGAHQPPKGSGARDHNFTVSPSHFGIIYTTPAHMTASERVMLYSLVFGLRPRRCLEIGTHRGGSALVIGAALDDVGAGHLVCVDPNPAIASEDWLQLSHHATLLKAPSPDALSDAVRAAGGHFDFVLIDAYHERSGVIRDIEGVLPILAPSAYLVLHDAHYHGVADAIDDMLKKYPNRLTDCGMISVEETPEDRIEDGHPVIWGGLRLLRYRVA